MGYTTEFTGCLKANKEIPKELKEYVNQFSYHRHMKRNADGCRALIKAGFGICYNDNVGTDGEYYLNMDNAFGQCKDITIIDYNHPGGDCPGLWCNWIINDNDELVWSGAEKFYDYTKWLDYLIKHFFAPNGIVWNGTFDWQGEDEEDTGTIIVDDNDIFIAKEKRIECEEE